VTLSKCLFFVFNPPTCRRDPEDPLLKAKTGPAEPIEALDPADPSLMRAHVSNVVVVGMPYMQVGCVASFFPPPRPPRPHPSPHALKSDRWIDSPLTPPPPGSSYSSLGHVIVVRAGWGTHQQHGGGGHARHADGRSPPDHPHRQPRPDWLGQESISSMYTSGVVFPWSLVALVTRWIHKEFWPAQPLMLFV
jgi:hypothetical protein